MLPLFFFFSPVGSTPSIEPNMRLKLITLKSQDQETDAQPLSHAVVESTFIHSVVSMREV